MEIKGDLTPAIDELRTIYDKLRAWYEGRSYNAFFVKNKPLRPVVIGISPTMPRRKEEGWYTPAKWESEGEQVFKTLTKQKQDYKYDEIFVTGESLSKSPLDIVRNMLHQLAHQIANTVQQYSQSTSQRTYHNAGFKYAMGLLSIGPSYDKSTGWTTIDWNIQGTIVNNTIQKIADEIDPMAFDTFRTSDLIKAEVQETRMKKWQCKSCINPKVVRCTGLLLASCNKCGDRFIYADKDRHTNSQVKHWVNYSNCEVLA